MMTSSVFANPSSSAVGDQAQAYIAGILDELGSRDALTVLRATPELLRSTLAAMPQELRNAPEAPGKWSVVQVVQHLADSELVGGYRFRMVMAHERPALTAYDQDLWAERLSYSNADAVEALAEFTSLRRANIRLFEHATETDLARIGIHAERGEESLAHLMKLYAGHDLVHLKQIDRIQKAVSSTH